jgi:putative flippase GtrA
MDLAPSMKPAEFLRFAGAGAVGFAVDSALLLAFTSGLGWPPLLSRLASFVVALVSTWLINRAWTFRAGAKSARAIGAEFAGYGAVQMTGGAANFAVYALVISLIGHGPLQLLAGLAAGAATGLAINYFGARKLVFGRNS